MAGGARVERPFGGAWAELDRGQWDRGAGGGGVSDGNSQLRGGRRDTLLDRVGAVGARGIWFGRQRHSRP